jgi:outer membrane protein OmpA-like peptidoglycan-associated protein
MRPEQHTDVDADVDADAARRGRPTPHGRADRRAHAPLARTAVCLSFSAVLLAATGPADATSPARLTSETRGVHGAPEADASREAKGPSPSPSPGAPSLPGADNPTTIPTAAPSLPGQGGAAAPSYSEPPDHIGESDVARKIDSRAPGLMLADGAKLAPPRVLDVKFVTEDMGGEERREDSAVKTKFTLQAEVLFPKDSEKLDSGAHARIRQIVDEIDRQRATRINVYGFTDDLGSYGHGKRLSRARAGAVQQALAEELGGDASFNVRGYSEDYPVADNRTEEGRKKNRRVEVSFPRKD